MAIEEKEEQTTSLKDLIELVEKDPIPTNVFTIEDKDPMVILGKLNEVIAYLKNLQATINSSDTKANQALESALKALSSASESLQASTTALNSSNKALETANLAIDTANQSLAGSNEAKTASNEAIAMANNALQIAQNALNQVVGGLGTKVYDNNGNLKSSVKFAGHNGINVDLAEDNETFDIRLDEDITKAIEDNHTAIEQTKAQAQANKEDIANLSEMVADNEESSAILNDRVTDVETNLTEINPKVARALLTPMSAPSTPKVVFIDENNAQNLAGVGGGLVYDGTTLVVSDVLRNAVGNNSSSIENINTILNNREIKLVWTNPNPSQDFTEQTISLGTNDFDFIIIEVCSEKTQTYNRKAELFISNSRTLPHAVFSSRIFWLNGETNRVGSRNWYFNDGHTSLVIQKCFWNTSTRNTDLIPTRIFVGRF